MSDAPYKFDFHIGDYLRDTEDLSMTQHGAYLRLMLWYYSTAKPLPNDLDRIFRRVNAASREEKAAVEYVLSEFFRLVEGKWTHKRIDRELIEWGIATQTARENAQKRWEKFKQNKDKTKADAMPQQCNGNANPDASLLPSTSYLPPLPPQWWENSGKTTAAAHKLGITPRPGEEWADFKERIRIEITKRKTTANS